MAGLPKSVNTDTPIDSHFLSYVNNLSTGGNTTNITSSKDTIKQYVKTKNGIFNGAFGSVGHALTISSGELDLTANATGAVVVRRMIQVNPESSTSDTIDKIESNGLELPYQELTLIATTNNTITLAHASSVSGTQKNIYCPGDTSYVLAPNEAVKLIYDPINTLWLVTGNASSSGGVTNPVNAHLSLGGNQLQRVTTMFLDGDGDNSNSIAGNSGGLDYNVDDTDETHDFKINGVTKFSVGNTGLYASTDISMQTNKIYLDSDIDTYIISSSDDTIDFYTGGTGRMNISNSGTTFVNQNVILTSSSNLTVDGYFIGYGNIQLGDSSSDTISMNGTLATDIEMGGNDLDFATGGTIDFHDIDTSSHSSGGAPALPAQPTAYFKVKYQGADRYIPYYS